MTHPSFQQANTWAGLMTGGAHAPADIATLQAILGAEAPMIFMEPGLQAVDVVRQLVSRRVTGVLTIAHQEGLRQLASVLRVCSSLANFRRVVVLRDGTLHDDDALDGMPVLVLRDCEEVRRTLRQLAQPEPVALPAQTAEAAPAAAHAAAASRCAVRMLPRTRYIPTSIPVRSVVRLSPPPG